MSVKVEKSFLGFTKAVIGATALVAMGGIVAAGKAIGALFENETNDTDEKATGSKKEDSANASGKSEASTDGDTSSENKSE